MEAVTGREVLYELVQLEGVDHCTGEPKQATPVLLPEDVLTE